MVDTVPTPPEVEPVGDAPGATPAKMSLPTLTGLVVASMVGAGVLPIRTYEGVRTDRLVEHSS